MCRWCVIKKHVIQCGAPLQGARFFGSLNITPKRVVTRLYTVTLVSYLFQQGGLIRLPASAHLRVSSEFQNPFDDRYSMLFYIYRFGIDIPEKRTSQSDGTRC